MTIASEITNYANGLSDAYGAVNDMGGIIPQDKNMNNLDTAIRTIPQSSPTPSVNHLFYVSMSSPGAVGDNSLTVYTDIQCTTTATYEELYDAIQDGGASLRAVYYYGGPTDVEGADTFFVGMCEYSDDTDDWNNVIEVFDYSGYNAYGYPRVYSYTADDQDTAGYPELPAVFTLSNTRGFAMRTDIPSDFTGATSSVAGTHGLVPAPTTSDPNKFLKGDGTWDTPTGTVYTAGYGIDIDNDNKISSAESVTLSLNENQGTFYFQLTVTPYTVFTYSSFSALFLSGKNIVVYIPGDTLGHTAEASISFIDTSSKTVYVNAQNIIYALDYANSSDAVGTFTVFEQQEKLTAGTNITISSGTISATDTTYSNMTGATSSVAGAAGLVPAPAAGDEGKALHGDGTWKDTTAKLVEMAYGEANAWAKFIAAYNAGSIVYCRASSNANPGTGSQTRKAFMAYVNDATTPTSVEFQYVRSVSSKTSSQPVDQVFVYTLKNTNGGTWSVATRDMAPKIAAGAGISVSYNNGTYTISLA